MRQEQHKCPACNKTVTVDIETVAHSAACSGCAPRYAPIVGGGDHWDGEYAVHRTKRIMRRVIQRRTAQPHDCPGYSVHHVVVTVQ